MLMSSGSEQLKKGSYRQGQGAHSRKEIADLIFEYASH